MKSYVIIGWKITEFSISFNSNLLVEQSKKWEGREDINQKDLATKKIFDCCDLCHVPMVLNVIDCLQCTISSDKRPFSLSFCLIFFLMTLKEELFGTENYFGL